MTFPELIGALTDINVRPNNNLAWRNMEFLPLWPIGFASAPFTFRPETGVKTVGIAIKPLDKPFPGTLVVDLGDSFLGWKLNGAQGTGFRQVSETALSFTGDGGSLQGLPPPDKTPLEGTLKLTFNSSNAPAGLYPLQINQLGGKDNTQDLGGVQYQVRVLASDTKPTATVLTPVRTGSTVELHCPHSLENTTYQVWRGPSADFKTTEAELIGKIDATKADVTTALVFKDAPPTGKVFFYRVESLNTYGSVLSDSVAADAIGN